MTRRRCAVGLRLCGRQAVGDQIKAHAQHNKLGFRIAKAAVELNNFRLTIRSYHQTGIQEPV